MPSATTKKPNNGSCAACNKEGAVLRCAPCRDAGVDVFFCNRECQVKLWKTHKAVCKKTSNGNLKKEHSSANKQAKTEGKKKEGPQLPKHKELCSNCLKKDTDLGIKLFGCSKCNFTYYCSRECQVKDWPRHKPSCKQSRDIAKNVETRFDSRERNIYDLFHKWKLTLPISAAVRHTLKKKGVELQPPVNIVPVEIEFNYNAQTFVVAEEPRAVAIAAYLNQVQKKQLCESYKNFLLKTAAGVDQKYVQFAAISTKELGRRFEIILPFVFSKRAFDTHIDMLSIRRCALITRMKSNLFRGWKSIRRHNLQKQLEQMNLGQSYTAFVQNALQFFCNKSLQNTHRIMVYMRMGNEIGQISQFLEYKVVHIAEYKEYKEENEKFMILHVEDIESRPPSCTEIMAIETLFVDPDLCFAFDYTVLWGVNVTKNKTAKQCKKAADKHYRKLQQSVKDMPSDLLEKVSL